MRVTYCVHNCFLLHWRDRVFLFDYPSARHRPPEVEELVRKAVTGGRCVFVASHAHGDHFTPALLELARLARAAIFLLADDIPDLHPEFHPDRLPNAVVLEPGEEKMEAGMRVRALDSTDQGVGFLLHWADREIWFGGDVACWDWPRLTPVASGRERKMWMETLDILKRRRLHLAFANADPRLPNFSGALDLLREANPAYMVPMHAFGDPAALEPFHRQALASGGRGTDTLFRYEKPGDALELPD